MGKDDQDDFGGSVVAALFLNFSNAHTNSRTLFRTVFHRMLPWLRGADNYPSRLFQAARIVLLEKWTKKKFGPAGQADTGYVRLSISEVYSPPVDNRLPQGMNGVSACLTKLLRLRSPLRILTWMRVGRSLEPPRTATTSPTEPPQKSESSRGRVHPSRRIRVRVVNKCRKFVSFLEYVMTHLELLSSIEIIAPHLEWSERVEKWGTTVAQV
jgi:hypothetical protein